MCDLLNTEIATIGLICACTSHFFVNILNMHEGRFKQKMFNPSAAAFYCFFKL